jgi:HSP20 family protein
MPRKKSIKHLKGKESGGRAEPEEGELTVDVYQTPGEIVIQTAVAGVNPEDLDIAITEDTVHIRGQREREEEISPKSFLCQECFWGPFSRKIILPHRVDADASQAVMKKSGILTIRLPKLAGLKEEWEEGVEEV